MSGTPDPSGSGVVITSDKQKSGHGPEGEAGPMQLADLKGYALQAAEGQG